jgi:hypothetical protein
MLKDMFYIRKKTSLQVFFSKQFPQNNEILSPKKLPIWNAQNIDDG